MAKQFDDVPCKYGAPMGRAEYGSIPEGFKAFGTVKLFRVRFIDGAYDDGGAYWGSPANLWCATDKERSFQRFTRANSRQAAFKNLGLAKETLIVRRGIIE